MKCNVEYTGKLRSGKPQYFCTTHKSLSCDSKGNRLDECLCLNKDSFNKILNLNEEKVDSLILEFADILTNQIPDIYINGKIHEGVFSHNDEILTYKDFTGILLVRINHIKLEKEVCKRCHKFHSDNGEFAYRPHLIHFCNYCGHKFRAKTANISHKLDEIFTIPDINFSQETINIDNKCNIKYDLFKGTLLVNDKNIGKVKINSKLIDIKDFLNNILKNEY